MISLYRDMKECFSCWCLAKKGFSRFNKRPLEPMDEPVDFLVTWVDGADPEWRAEREKYQREIGIFKEHKDNGEERYRDWGTFRYWFRAVEKYAPWVRHVYLITSGQVPEWLNLESPKLKFVKHSDYIPKEYLPTFNANVIEMNFHRIKDLSEHFVYFNDDLFLMKPSKPEDFFRGGKPNTTAIAIPLRNRNNGAFSHMNFTVLGAINSRFSGRMVEIVNKNPELWFNQEYDIQQIKTMYSIMYNRLLGMCYPHLCAPFRKSTFRKMWEEFPELMHETSTHRFRTAQDVQDQIVTLWEIMTGQFNPVRIDHFGRAFYVPMRQLDQIVKAIRENTCLTICVNDSENVSVEDVDTLRETLIRELEQKFPEKSSFEK